MISNACARRRPIRSSDTPRPMTIRRAPSRDAVAATTAVRLAGLDDHLAVRAGRGGRGRDAIAQPALHRRPPAWIDDVRGRVTQVRHRMDDREPRAERLREARAPRQHAMRLLAEIHGAEDVIELQRRARVAEVHAREHGTVGIVQDALRHRADRQPALQRRSSARRHDDEIRLLRARQNLFRRITFRDDAHRLVCKRRSAGERRQCPFGRAKPLLAHFLRAALRRFGHRVVERERRDDVQQRDARADSRRERSGVSRGARGGLREIDRDENAPDRGNDRSDHRKILARAQWPPAPAGAVSPGVGPSIGFCVRYRAITSRHSTMVFAAVPRRLRSHASIASAAA